MPRSRLSRRWTRDGTWRRRVGRRSAPSPRNPKRWRFAPRRSSPSSPPTRLEHPNPPRSSRGFGYDCPIRAVPGAADASRTSRGPRRAPRCSPSETETRSETRSETRRNPRSFAPRMKRTPRRTRARSGSARRSSGGARWRSLPWRRTRRARRWTRLARVFAPFALRAPPRRGDSETRRLGDSGFRRPGTRRRCPIARAPRSVVFVWSPPSLFSRSVNSPTPPPRFAPSSPRVRERSADSPSPPPGRPRRASPPRTPRTRRRRCSDARRRRRQKRRGRSRSWDGRCSAPAETAPRDARDAP